MKAKLFLAAITLTVLLIYSCEELEYYSDCVEGEGPETEKLFIENTFSGLELNSSFNIIVKQGPVQEIKAVGQKNIIDDLEIYEKNGELVCGLRNGCYRDYKLTLYITVPGISYLKTFGSGSITMEDFSNQGNLKTEVSGSGDIIINGSAGTQNLQAVISGSGDIIANKYVPGLNSVDVIIHGSGSFRAYHLETKECYAYIFGSGNCYNTVSSKLKVEITGSGDVYYKGDPIVYSKCSGSGRVVSTN